MSESLYVGDLGLDVNETDLEQVFSAVGRVRSVTVCRDMKTKVSLRYAYVNMADPGAGKIALQKLNYSPLKGKMMRIMPVVRDPKTRKLGIGNLYVTGLPQNFSNHDLFTYFGALGTVTSCKVATDDFGVSLGYGYVAYENDDLAKLAIQRYNNTSLNGSTLTVKPFVKSKKSAQAAFNNVYVKNLADSVTEAQLTDAFSAFGPVLSTCLKSDDQRRQFAFVTFQNMDDAAECVKEMNGKAVEGLTDFEDLYVARAMKRKERDNELKKMFDEESGVVPEQQYWTGANVPPAPYVMPPPGVPPMMVPPPHLGMHPHHVPHHHHQHHPAFNNKAHQSKLYFKIPDPKFDDNTIRAAFAEHGDVKQVNIRREAQGASGVVYYATPSMASKALAAMRGKPLKGSTAPIVLKYSTRDNFGPGPAPTPSPFGMHHPPPFGAPGAIGYQGDMWGKPSFNRVAPPTVHGRGGRSSHMGPNGFSGLTHKNGPPSTNQSKIARQLADLSSKSEADQRDAIGTIIYHEIKNMGHSEDRAGKITGMLLAGSSSSSPDIAELLNLMEPLSNLEAAVRDALDALRKHEEITRVKN